MKKGKVINSDISRVIAQMGHFDKLSIGDAGMPVPFGTEKSIWLSQTVFQAFYLF